MSAIKKLALVGLSLTIGCTFKDSGVTIHNTEPNASLDVPVDGASFDAGEAIEFMGTVGDNEDHPTDLTVTWSSDVDGILQSGIPADDDGTSLLTSGSLSVGGHIIILHVADTKGKTAEDSISLLVVKIDASPEINIIRPSDSDVGTETADFEFEAVVFDEQDEASSLDVAFWVLNGSSEELLCEATPNSDGVATCSAGLLAGQHDLVATVMDSDGNTGEDRFNNFEVLTADEVDDDLDGYSEDEGDCDDTDDNIHPGAAEIANGIDDNCDGQIDEGTDDVDDDLDGFSELEGDCNDEDDTIFPGAEETLNEIDDDCDGTIDENTDAYDDDGDCFCEEAPCTGSITAECEDITEGDCDDTDEDIHPEASEICDDIDNDCDGDIDSEDAETDTDGDGYSACDDEDCDDTNADIRPSATEMCDDVDNDCDGSIDEDDAADASSWYADVDDDGYGDPDAIEVSCEAPEGYIADDNDCNDLDDDTHPGATEVCDLDDNDEDCDGRADDEDAEGASGTTMWFRDLDADGFGDSTTWTYACDRPSGYIENNDDCDDWAPEAYPGRTETCDGIDNDCDGTTDEEDSTGCENYYIDYDGDGFGHETDRRCLCEPDPSTHYDVTDNSDCCDVSASTFPGATDWHDSWNACYSHDWNCDEEEERRWTTTGSCGSSLGTELCYDDPAGWLSGYVPPCGSNWAWLDDCSTECDWPWDCWCEEEYDYKDQNCR